MQVSRKTLRSLRRVAERATRSRDEADDLVQDVLVAALEQTHEWNDGRFVAWASGVIRRRASFLARTAARRRRRDANFATELEPRVAPDAKLPASFVRALPDALRNIALLANAGLGRAEIAALLGISDVALRKRISDLRIAWRRARADAELALQWPSQLAPCGLRRRSLRATLRRLPSACVAVTDPDGHPIFLRRAHESDTRGNQAP